MAEKKLKPNIDPTTLPEEIQAQIKAAGDQLLGGITGVKPHTSSRKSTRSGKGQQL